MTSHRSHYKPHHPPFYHAHKRWKDFVGLLRLDKPIGTLLLLWPTFTALWLASDGHPSKRLIFIFGAGVILMRAAGCVINDFADRHWDRHVFRTRNRPLTQGKISNIEALALFCVLCALAFCLVLMTNFLTISLAFIALALASLYPFTKRFTYFPQIFLGAAFSMGIPMAFSATQNALPHYLWLLYIFNWVWTIAYDTQYAMVDREDDKRIGIKSIALFFGDNDRLAVVLLQAISLLPLMLLAKKLELSFGFIMGLALIAALFVYQFTLMTARAPQHYLKAFLNNAWVGAALYSGTILHYSHIFT